MLCNNWYHRHIHTTKHGLFQLNVCVFIFYQNKSESFLIPTAMNEINERIKYL